MVQVDERNRHVIKRGKIKSEEFKREKLTFLDMLARIFRVSTNDLVAENTGCEWA